MASRSRSRAEITTDGLPGYAAAVERAFGWNGADHGQLVNTYGIPTHETGAFRRYRPAVCTGAVRISIMGKLGVTQVPTSYIERFNLSVRMGNRRMTRLTNGFSKSAENHGHPLAIQLMRFDHCRLHQTLTKANKGIKTIPAMAAGHTDHVWTVEEVVEKMSRRSGPRFRDIQMDPLPPT